MLLLDVMTFIFKLLEVVVTQDGYFVKCKDAFRKMGLFSFKRCKIVIHMLTHGIANDAVNEYCHLGENTTMEILKIFVWAIW
jgi:hypothetical protein